MSFYKIGLIRDYWPRKMNINSWRVFREGYAPYLIAGIAISAGCHYTLNFTSNDWASFFIKGVAFVVFYSSVVYFLLKKKDKEFFLNIIKRGA